jgi:cytochrome c
MTEKMPVVSSRFAGRFSQFIAYSVLCCLSLAKPAIGNEQLDGDVARVLAITGDKEYGEYLAGDCVTCHQNSGTTEGIVPIAGLPKDYVIKALFEYRLSIRKNDAMKIRVSRMSDDEIAALAAYFSALERNE